MDDSELFGDQPPLVLAERIKASSMTNAKRLAICAMPMAGDILTSEEDLSLESYFQLVGDSTSYNLRVVTGQGVHGNGARLYKDADGNIRRVRENIRSLLRFVPPPEFAAFLESRNMTQEEFVKRVLELPSAVSSDT